MMQITRRHMLGAAGGIAVSSTLGAPWIGRARAAEFTYKFGSDVADTHPTNVRMREAAAAISQETNGQVEIKVFANSQLGGTVDMFSQLRAGALEFLTVSGANALSALVPKAAIPSVGFAFQDYAQVYKVVDGKLGDRVRELITKAGLVVQDKVWDNGFRQVTNSLRPINGPEDLKGLRIRTPPGNLFISLFQSLSAAPTPMSFSEVYTALQTKLVEGQENPLAVTDASKLYEVQKYCSLTSHVWDGFWMLGNAAAWKRLSPGLRDIVSKQINAAALNQRRDLADLNSSLQQSLAAKGLVFNKPDPEPFRQALRKQGFYTKWRQTFGEDNWALLEEVTGKLA